MNETTLKSLPNAVVTVGNVSFGNALPLTHKQPVQGVSAVLHLTFRTP